MFCNSHQEKLEYFSILQAEQFYGKLLCQQCIAANEKFKFQNNYFSLDSLVNGSLVNFFEAKIKSVSVLQFSNPKTENFILSVERVFGALENEISTLKSNFIQTIIENTPEHHLRSAADYLKGLSLDSRNILTKELPNEIELQNLAKKLTQIKNSISINMHTKSQTIEKFSKVYEIRLNEWFNHVKHSLNKIEEVLTAKIVDCKENFYSKGVCHFNPNLELLNKIPPMIQKEMEEVVEGYEIFQMKVSPLLFAETSSVNSKSYFYKVFDPYTLKSLAHYRNYDNMTGQGILTQKKKYLIKVENYNTSSPHCLNSLSILQLTSKGIKRIARIVTRLMSHIEYLEDFEHIIAGEKLVIFVYQIHTRKCVQKIILSDTINVIKYLPNIQVLLIGGNELHGYSIINGRVGPLKYSLQAKRCSLAHIQIDNVTNNVYCFHADGTIRIWKLTTDSYSLVCQCQAEISPFEVYSFPEKQIFIGNCPDDTVSIISMSNGKSLSKIQDMERIISIIPKDEFQVVVIFLSVLKIGIKQISYNVEPTCSS